MSVASPLSTAIAIAFTADEYLFQSIDVDLPACCDDVCWTHEDPELAFKQPPSNPSYVTYFVYAIKLSRILAVALRTIVGMQHLFMYFTNGHFTRSTR